MGVPSHPQQNLLAATGHLVDPTGSLVALPRGPLQLGWLFEISAESARRGREILARDTLPLDEATRLGWFCAASSTDLKALDLVEQQDWRQALRLWRDQGDQPWALHNRATLHRLLAQRPQAEQALAHQRKAWELYHRLTELQGSRYAAWAAWAQTETERLLELAAKSGQDEEVARGLALILALRGPAACEEWQDRLMLDELDDLALLGATVAQELLPFQGVARRPPPQVLSQAERQLEQELLPLAVRLAFRLVPETRQRSRLNATVAELCGLMAQTFYKAQDARQGRKWQNQAQRWEPEVAKAWPEPEEAHLGDEQTPQISYREPEPGPAAAPLSAPLALGPRWLGVHLRPSLLGSPSEEREEWLEAFRILGLAVFPLGRWAVYRHPDTGEVSPGQRLPTRWSDTLWQAVVLVLLSLGLLSLLLAGRGKGSAPATPARPTASPTQNAPPAAQLERALARLKRLAQVEAELRQAATPDTQRLQAIATERRRLIETIERLERRP